jgi:hypothetical protein
MQKEQSKVIKHQNQIKVPAPKAKFMATNKKFIIFLVTLYTFNTVLVQGKFTLIASNFAPSAATL